MTRSHWLLGRKWSWLMEELRARDENDEWVAHMNRLFTLMVE